ncbi:L-threonate dehydrogenase [Halomonas urumqiensis]|uniref:L-threonate dehydrogenase n=1 Tax=Halomonas urumqiensis TaxID=1684789 RepID=A0A2N7UQK3_9GAMM|nr:L-threonate dehydrogenase [Halomonas urumqiensis]PMR82692.1 3-hydroxyisobutyrate dehydrogenase [Halomonas urumqiensis]PTB01989.1 3-hydroxyisobutyrate dehydrogenase [Halomonas urumqiensis]GHE22103.1 3-hydroxyisobutyrate dehydrogenase [Halomonas urumqiensis]
MSESSKQAPRVGVIGLGAMGMGTATALLEQGLDVMGCDISAGACDAFVECGGKAVQFPSALGDRDIVLVVVVNGEQVEQVLFGDHGVAGHLSAGSLIVQCATVAPSQARSLGERLGESGIRMLDAPISGGAAKARSGELSVMASGGATAFDQAQPVLDAMAATVYRLGDAPGVGSSMKLVNQLLAGVHIATAAEAMALGIRMGLDPDTVYEVITHSAGNSWMFENRMPHVLKGDYTPLSAVDIFVKDLNIVHETGRELAMPTPVAASALQQFTAAKGAGFGREDDSAVIKVYQRLSGISLPEAANDDMGA